MEKTSFDIHQHITDKIIDAIETGRAKGNDFQMPWHSVGVSFPVNRVTGKAYNGINIIMLWIMAQEKGYGSGQWATFKQWQQLGYSVRKGEKGSRIVYYNELEKENEDGNIEKIPFAKGSVVFAAEQIEGYELPKVSNGTESFKRVQNAEDVIRNTQAKIRFEGQSAYYRPSTDEIVIPPAETFRPTATGDTQGNYYSTVFHELSHWTAAKGRCDRDLSGRFKTQSYAMEELVAELSAAFLCAHCGVEAEPRLDHAQYIDGWLTVLKNDKKAIFSAASAASKATQYIMLFTLLQDLNNHKAA